MKKTRKIEQRNEIGKRIRATRLSSINRNDQAGTPGIRTLLFRDANPGKGWRRFELGFPLRTPSPSTRSAPRSILLLLVTQELPDQHHRIHLHAVQDSHSTGANGESTVIGLDTKSTRFADCRFRSGSRRLLSVGDKLRLL